MSSHARFSRRELLRRSALTAGGLAAASVLGGAQPVFGAVAPSAVGADMLSYARVWARTPRQAAALAWFDETHAVHADGSIEVLLWPGDRKRLDALGVDYRVFNPHRGNAVAARGRTSGLALQPGERTGYRVLGDYVTDLQALATKYPQSARMIKFPEKTLEGRDVYGIEIADDIAAAQTDGRPTFWIDGAHHSREWPSSEYTLMFGFDLLESFGADPRVTALMSKLRFVLVPIVNVDGFVTSREAVYATTPADQDIPWAITGTMTGWRKNRRSYTGALYGPANTRSELNLDAHGVDPNRNYPMYWGGEGGEGADPQSQTYGGAAPYSEPESRNIAGGMKAAQVTAYLTNHTYGKLCMRPWGFTRDPSPDDKLQTDLGAAMCAFHNYTNQIGLSLYPTAGTSRDWSYGALRTLVYTFEHGSMFHPAYAANIPKTYAINRPAWLLLAEAAADPSNHVVVTGRLADAAGAPVAGEVTLSKSFKTPTVTEIEGKKDDGVAESILTRAVSRPDGSFEIHANPSTRPHSIMFGWPAESWTVRAGTYEGSVVADRGDRVDLGTITV
jgi:Zinc carboxypeptidase